MLPDLQVEPIEDPPSVLLVEDDVLLRGLLAEAMRDAGFSVIEAASADEAQRYLQASTQPDLIFSDVEMPGSMNGIELGRWVRRTYPQIGVILTSGAAAPDASQLGHFIPKPFRIIAAVKIARDLAEAKRSQG
jgi:CheY-like chemotaxis protein